MKRSSAFNLSVVPRSSFFSYAFQKLPWSGTRLPALLGGRLLVPNQVFISPLFSSPLLHTSVGLIQRVPKGLIKKKKKLPPQHSPVSPWKYEEVRRFSLLSCLPLNLSYNLAPNSASVHRGVLLSHSKKKKRINPFIKLRHGCGWKGNIAYDLLLVWGSLQVLSHLSNTVTLGSESGLQPKSPVTFRSANTAKTQRASLSPPDFFILFPFIRFSSLWRAFAAVDSSVHGIWNVTLSPQSLCAFVPVNQFTLATTGIPKTRRMWYLSKSPGFIKAVIPLCNDVINIQVELLVYAFFFSFLPIYSKIESWEACKNGSCVFWVPVVRWWNSPSSDKQAAFNMQMVEKRRHTATKKPQRYPVLGQCCRYT